MDRDVDHPHPRPLHPTILRTHFEGGARNGFGDVSLLIGNTGLRLDQVKKPGQTENVWFMHFEPEGYVPTSPQAANPDPEKFRLVLAYAWHHLATRLQTQPDLLGAAPTTHIVGVSNEPMYRGLVFLFGGSIVDGRTDSQVPSAKRFSVNVTQLLKSPDILARVASQAQRCEQKHFIMNPKRFG